MRISLIIPTRERDQFLASCLDTALSTSDPDLEIIVSDNYSCDDTAGIVAARKHPQLLYTRTSERCSMRANFEHGLRAASGDYVMFIGDDDGVIPSGFTYLRELLEYHRPDAVAWRPVPYYWPSEATGERSGYVRLKASMPYRGTRSQSHSQILSQVCTGRLRSYRDAANIYHGCISRDVIERVRAAQGSTYFRGAIPDVYTSIANLVQMSAPLIWAGHPVSIGGVSPRSNGASQMSRSTVRRAGLDEVSSFKKEASYDRNAASIDVSIPSVDALTFDMLNLALDGTSYHAQVDIEVWLRRIRQQLVKLPRPKYIDGARALDAYCRSKGLAEMLRRIEIAIPFAGPEEAHHKKWPQISQLEVLKITLANSTELRTVAQASVVVDDILGIHRLNSGKRWTKWMGALWRANCMIRRWRTNHHTSEE